MNRNFMRQKFYVRKVKCLVRATDRKMSVWRMETSDNLHRIKPFIGNWVIFGISLRESSLYSKIIPNHRVCRTLKKKVNFVFYSLHPQKGQCLLSFVV